VAGSPTPAVVPANPSPELGIPAVYMGSRAFLNSGLLTGVPIALLT